MTTHWLRWCLLLPWFAVACSAGHAPGPVPRARHAPAATSSAEPTACELARAQRNRVPALLQQGRLDRALRVMRKANDACPQERWRTWAAQVAVLAELGLWSEMRSVADAIDTQGDRSARQAAAAARAHEQRYHAQMDHRDDARGPMRLAYRDATLASYAGKYHEAQKLYLKAWELSHPNGQALMQAGLMARLLGENAEAQRLFDRAVVELEAVTNKRLAVDTTDGFSRPVAAVAWSGDTIAAASGPYISILDPSNLWERLRLEAHAHDVTSVAFSPDGQRLASGSEDKTVRLWDVETGRSLATLHGQAEQVMSVAFSPSGKTLAVASQNTVVLRDADLGGPSATLQGHAWHVRSLAFSPDGAKLVSGSDDRTARLWDVRTGQSLAKLEQHAVAITSLAYSPDGSRLACCSLDHTLHLWPLSADASRQHLATLRAFPCHAVAFSPDGSRLVLAGDGPVELWDVGTERKLTALDGQNWRIASVAFSPDGTTLATGSWNHTVRLWDMRSNEGVATLDGHAHFIHSVAFSPDGARIASGSHDMTVRIWDVVTRKETFLLQGHSDAVWSVAFSPDRKRLASGSSDRTVRLWNVSSGQDLATLHGHGGTVRAVAFSPEGWMLASGSDDTTVRLWDMRTGQGLASLRRHTEAVSSVVFSPDGDWLASGSSDGDIILWNPAHATYVATLRSFTGTPGGVVFSGDGYVDVVGPKADVVRSFVRCRVGPVMVPFPVCAERYEVRGLLGRVLAGDSSYREP